MPEQKGEEAVFSPGNADGDDRHMGDTSDEGYAFFPMLETSIMATMPFREDPDFISAGVVNYCLNSIAIRMFAVYHDGLHSAEDSAEEGDAEELGFGKPMDAFAEAYDVATSQGRIDIVEVV